MPDKTAAQQWHDDYKQGVEVTMPHNNRVVRLRSVSTAYLAKTGKLPDGVLTMIGMDALGIDGESSKKAKKMTTMDYINATEQYNEIICREALVSPRIVAEGKVADSEQNEIEYQMLTDDDKTFIVETINKPVNEWARFRQESTAGMELVSNGKKRRTPAE